MSLLSCGVAAWGWIQRKESPGTPTSEGTVKGREVHDTVGVRERALRVLAPLTYLGCEMGVLPVRITIVVW